MDDTTAPNGPSEQARGPWGQYVATDTAARTRAEACRLRSRGLSYQAVADQMGISKSAAWEAVQKGLAEIVREPAEALLAMEAERLDSLYVAAMDVLEREHVMVSHGRVVVGDDGRPLLDDGPKLAAIRELRAIRESYRKLHGLDAAQKVDLSGGVRYEIVGVDPSELT